MVSILSPISNYSSLFSKLLGTVPSSPTTISITINLMSHSILVLRLGPSDLSFRFLFISVLRSAGIAKSFWRQVLVFLLIIPRWSVGNIVIFEFLAQFPMNHLSYPIVSRLVHFLFQFTAFAHFVINGLLSICNLPTLAIQVHTINFHFKMIGLYAYLPTPPLGQDMTHGQGV